MNAIKPLLKKNDSKAKTIIGILSAVVFLTVVALGKFKPLLSVEFGFNRYIFAHIIGVINSLVSVLLIIGLIQVKRKQFAAHQRTMLAALILSSIFLVFYIIHHMANPDTPYGGSGVLRYIYYAILITHIILAAGILPFILFTAYRASIGEFTAHKKIARITYPLWLYVSLSGVIVYLFIRNYYGS